MRRERLPVQRLRVLLHCMLLLGTLACAPRLGAQEPQAAPVTVVLVRHAEKLDDSDDPPLNAAGEQRAQSLVHVLEHAGVTAILSTRFRRTRDTAAPLAARTGLDVQVVETAGGAAAHAAAFAARLRGMPPGSVVLVVGHSNTVPAIIAALGGPDVGRIEDEEYSNVFVLQLDAAGTRLIRGRY